MFLSVLLNPPADVVDGDVPQLLVHRRLTLLAGMRADGGLRVLVGHMDFYLAAPLKSRQTGFLRKNKGEILECMKGAGGRCCYLGCTGCGTCKA